MCEVKKLQQPIFLLLWRSVGYVWQYPTSMLCQSNCFDTWWTFCAVNKTRDSQNSFGNRSEIVWNFHSETLKISIRETISIINVLISAMKYCVNATKTAHPLLELLDSKLSVKLQCQQFVLNIKSERSSYISPTTTVYFFFFLQAYRSHESRWVENLQRKKFNMYVLHHLLGDWYCRDVRRLQKLLRWI